MAVPFHVALEIVPVLMFIPLIVEDVGAVIEPDELTLNSEDAPTDKRAVGAVVPTPIYPFAPIKSLDESPPSPPAEPWIFSVPLFNRLNRFDGVLPEGAT